MTASNFAGGGVFTGGIPALWILEWLEVELRTRFVNFSLGWSALRNTSISSGLLTWGKLSKFVPREI